MSFFIPRAAGTRRRRWVSLPLLVLLLAVPALLPVTAGAATTTYGASADGAVAAAGGSMSRTSLTVDGSPLVESFLRFSVSGLSGTVQRATLRLYAVDGGVDGPAVYPAATTWSEPKLTWATRPVRTGPAAADLGAVPAGAFVSLDVTSLVAGNGTYSFGLASASADEVVFASREAKTKTQRPQLVVETATVTTIDVTPPQTSISSGPASATTSTTAVFAFSASEPATFSCQLDTAAVETTCTSGRTYNSLSLGAHTFAVWATDARGNVDATPATWNWTVTEPGNARSAPLAPPSGAHFGVHVQVDNGATAAVQEDALLDFEAALGRTQAIDHHYEPWGDVFPTWRDTWDLAGGRIPMISWGKVVTTDVTAGKYDSYIAARADGIRSLAEPVFLRWLWEMDGSAKAVYSVSPADYIAAWHHIRAIFAQRGATNAVWVWCPNASAFRTGEAQTYYPGDDAVDWICADGYNWYPDSGRAYETFESKFIAVNDFAVSRGKPAMAGEYASQEMEPGRRAQWINDLRQSLKTRLTGIMAVNWFHSLTSEHDWRLLSEPDAFDAFRQMGLDPFFTP